MIDPKITLDELNQRNRNNLAEVLGIEFTQISKESLSARMPVNARTVQPLGILHGGASAALAETVGSMAAYMSVDREKYYTVGLEIKCNHLRSERTGWVNAIAIPVHLGRRTHLWKIEIKNSENKMVCYCSLTMAVLPVDDEKLQEISNYFF